jgi:hypothetical protein
MIYNFATPQMLHDLTSIHFSCGARLGATIRALGLLRQSIHSLCARKTQDLPKDVHQGLLFFSILGFVGAQVFMQTDWLKIFQHRPLQWNVSLANDLKLVRNKNLFPSADPLPNFPESF